MFKYHLIVAIRNLYKYRFYSLVNILGLAFGAALFTLLFLLIRHELSYDTFYRKADRTYRVVEKIDWKGMGEFSSSMPYPFASTISKQYPQYVESAVRLFNFQLVSHPIAVGNQRYNESKLYFADSNFFEVFDIPLALGERATAFQAPNAVIISKNIAEKYFGDENPLGRQLLYANKIPLLVTGVFESRTYTSHLDIELLVSFKAVDSWAKRNVNTWVWNPCWTYVVLRPEVNPDDLEFVFPEFIQKFFPFELKNRVTLSLQPITEIHLYSDLDYEMNPNGDIIYVYIFWAIAAFIIIITSINFTNLSTARSSVRTREIGIRKAIGADKSELLNQFFVEYLFISLLAAFIGLILVELMLPTFSQLLGMSLDLLNVNRREMLVCVLVSGLLMGMISSNYPAYYLAQLDPASALSGYNSLIFKGNKFRSALVVIQLVMTAVLMVYTFISYEQLLFLRRRDLGFHKENILVIPISNYALRTRIDEVTHHLLLVKGVSSVTVMDETMGVSHQTHPFHFDSLTEDFLACDLSKQEEALADSSEKGDIEFLFFPSIMVRDNFIETFDIELVAGRNFSRCCGIDTTEVIVNEELTRFMGWSNAQESIGKILHSPGGKERIVGVMRDFHFESLHQKITPLVLELPNNPMLKNAFSRFIAVRYQEDLPRNELIEQIESAWKALAPFDPLEYFFLSDKINSLYFRELRLARITLFFSLTAIGIASLGLFGLSFFLMAQRRREVAIRKAMGSTDWEILVLLSREFVALVALSIVLACPIAYLLADVWLGNFPFHIDVSWQPFVIMALCMWFIAGLTISVHTIRASLRNPVHDLQA